MKVIFLAFVLVGATVGCSSEEAPVHGDNPAAAGGRDVTPDMARPDAPPRNIITLAA